MITDTPLITHEYETCPLEATRNSIKNRLHTMPLPKNVTLEEMESIVDELSQFGFGRYLLQNRGINGKWTQYMVLYPQLWKASPNDLEGNPQTNFERWMLTTAPTLLATQERFTIFQKIIQSELQDGQTLASIPCGTMDDLLRLDYVGPNNVQLIGLDLDPESLALASNLAEAHGLTKQCSFIHADAWAMPLNEELDILTSNGLNIYEHDEKKVIKLYATFLKALKPGGLLVTSFLTPPPSEDRASPWDFSAIDKAAMAIQKLIFADILEAKWRSYHTESETRAQLEAAGVEDINIHYDKAKLFPTATARKPHQR